MTRITFDKVAKSFPHSAGQLLLRHHLLNWFGSGHRERFFALRDVSFRIGNGESVGLIGHNGAGKSTVLGLLAGLAQPDSGKVKVDGTVAALLELGSGFHYELTGAENLILNASLLGMSRSETYRKMGDIVEFADLGDFIHEPIRTYSTGMLVRLAFSIAIHRDPDIMIVDEVLAVGDVSFQQKSGGALREFRRRGKTLIIVSHSALAVRTMCDRAIWLDHGQVMADGDVEEVLANYEGHMLGTQPTPAV